MHRNQSVSAHSFAMVPRADIPRSRFNVQTSHKTTFDAGKLIPIYVDEVLPGDTFSLSCTAFGVWLRRFFPLWTISIWIRSFLCALSFGLG